MRASDDAPGDGHPRVLAQRRRRLAGQARQPVHETDAMEARRRRGLRPMQDDGPRRGPRPRPAEGATSRSPRVPSEPSPCRLQARFRYACAPALHSRHRARQVGPRWSKRSPPAVPAACARSPAIPCSASATCAPTGWWWSARRPARTRTGRVSPSWAGADAAGWHARGDGAVAAPARLHPPTCSSAGRPGTAIPSRRRSRNASRPAPAGRVLRSRRSS